jgi:hypothetical protein
MNNWIFNHSYLVSSIISRFARELVIFTDGSRIEGKTQPFFMFIFWFLTARKRFGVYPENLTISVSAGSHSSHLMSEWEVSPAILLHASLNSGPMCKSGLIVVSKSANYPQTEKLSPNLIFLKLYRLKFEKTPKIGKYLSNKIKKKSVSQNLTISIFLYKLIFFRNSVKFLKVLETVKILSHKSKVFSQKL